MTRSKRDRSRVLPLHGVRVLEFTQMIMGPAAGLVLAELGAEVIRIEQPPSGDPTRALTGFLSGVHGFFNRNKKSVSINLKHPEGIELVHRLVAQSDVVIENFAPGTMSRLGCDTDVLRKINPRLIYCSLKGFLPGPYENRLALDEVVQFMGGLAYMTGPAGRPLRAGSSVVDIMGAVVGVVGILAALRERESTGEGQIVRSGLFESTVFLMGQHMAAAVGASEPIPPMPERRAGFGIYDLFGTADGGQIFIAVTGDAQWQRFCETLSFDELIGDERLDSNAKRCEAREWLIPQIAARMRVLSKDEIVQLCDAARIPFAPLANVETLFDDPHLNQSGALQPAVIGDLTAKLPRVPLVMSNHEIVTRNDAPQIGQDTSSVLHEIGIAEEAIGRLRSIGVINASSQRAGM